MYSPHTNSNTGGARLVGEVRTGPGVGDRAPPAGLGKDLHDHSWSQTPDLFPCIIPYPHSYRLLHHHPRTFRTLTHVIWGDIPVHVGAAAGTHWSCYRRLLEDLGGVLSVRRRLWGVRLEELQAENGRLRIGVSTTTRTCSTMLPSLLAPSW